MDWQAVEAIGTAVAGIFAYAAWRTSQETLRLSYWPVLRPVPTTTLDTIKIKNIGNGPAVAVMVVDAKRPEAIIGEVQVVEKLGERGETGEANRVGNINMKMQGNNLFTRGRSYRLFCQDISGVWHETTFEVTV